MNDHARRIGKKNMASSENPAKNLKVILRALKLLAGGPDWLLCLAISDMARGYGATAARLTPDQKVGSSNLSALIFRKAWGSFANHYAHLS